MIVQVSNQQSAVRIDAALLRRGVKAALKGYAPAHRPGCEVSVAVVDDAQIARLHGEYMNDPTPTDVITFPLVDEEDEGYANPVLGEIVLSAETARREAKRRGHTIKSELLLYAIHGALHLAGWDDTPAAAAKEMEARQQYLLAHLLAKP